MVIVGFGGVEVCPTDSSLNWAVSPNNEIDKH